MPDSKAEELIRGAHPLDVVLHAVEADGGEHWIAPWLAAVASARRSLAELSGAVQQRADFPLARPFLAHWLHTAALRVPELPHDPELHAFHAELREQGDLLGWLPLVRTPLERREYLRPYLPRRGEWERPERPLLPASSSSVTPVVLAVPEPPNLRALLDWDWVRVPLITRHLTPSPHALSRALLMHLGLPSAQATSLTPEDMFAALYWIGATNGLEEGRSIQPCASLGRLFAWRFLAAMTSTSMTASCADVELATRACSFAGTPPGMLVAVCPDGLMIGVVHG